MPSPKTTFELIDQSGIKRVNTVAPSNPLFMASITSDYGPEALTLVDKGNFYKLFGNKIDFSKHGQPLLQTARLIDNGGRVLVKRVVADDSKLANIVICLKISVTQDGQFVTPIAYTVANGTDINSIKLQLNSFMTENDTTNTWEYPVLAILDNGRGLSNKRFRISIDMNTTKRLNKYVYVFEILDGTTVVETLRFSMVPGTSYNYEPYSSHIVINNNSVQVRSVNCDKYIDKFFATIVRKFTAVSGEEMTAEYIQGMDDIFNGENNRRSGKALFKHFPSEADFCNVYNVFGTPLLSGSNGAFGESPIASASYESQTLKFWQGVETDEIWDTTKYQLDVILDADYTASIKRAIEALIDFRQDGFFFRDMGIGVNTITAMKAIQSQVVKSMYSASYHISYDIIDPYSSRQISVTCMYALAGVIVSHLVNGRHRPFAGDLYGVILTEAIPNTINFVPRVTPNEDQREILDDARINYGSYYGDTFVFETQYTSYSQYSQFSYVNNILIVQELLKAIKERCPRIRYSFATDDDLANYKEDVERVINRFIDKFDSVTFQYIEDVTMVQNKIFYAAIEVKFKDYIQSEYFKIYAIN